MANKNLYNKILLLQKESTSIANVYEKLWELVDTETVDLLLFENQEIAKINRNLWGESNLINTGLMMNVLENTPCNLPLQYRLKDIKQPTLIITGVFDRNTGVNISKIIHRELTNSTLELFNNSAHFPDLEETEKFINVVLEFLKS
ncbi:alpha/beta hydrolase [Fictibacillus sp. KIGAM418]|uniref:Alpha/beta hydrolase n=1 Tax=Fictibacillus marinisediminis TaxID=2878389 RepID=A0A9X2BE13_9BACL|nr:alpha/beta hydrolase [Fictibacillus marinisediminis]MCK6258176.1 alpha/beta hydrolase [Fictibacillus marinisediminis]